MEQKSTALVSVYNKNGITEFAHGLADAGWDILSSGGTARHLREAGIPVRDVAELVGEPILGHRVVTLSREVHAGLLARDIPEDIAELERLGIPRIDLVCVDLYPLQEEIKNPAATRSSVIEKTDIGGPTMIRSAAKGERIVVCDPLDRERVLAWLRAGRPDEESFKKMLQAKAEYAVAAYCLASGRYHGAGRYDGMLGEQVLECKYGENAWQTPAGFFSARTDDPLSLEKFQVIAGTAPSYNNLCDLDRLLQTATHIAAGLETNHIPLPFVGVAVKHGNTCGAAAGADPIAAVRDMVRGDLRAIFGGLVLVNFEITEAIAEELLTHGMAGGVRRLLDGIVAPLFAPGAVELLKRKGDKCRFFANPALATLGTASLDRAARFRSVRGGFLRQPNYTFVFNLFDPRLETSGEATKAQERDLVLAWAVGATSNSNTTTLVKNGAVIGNAVGQQDRVGSCELAVKRARDAGHDVAGAVAYTDSFFPFPDGPAVLADAGVSAMLATSGSVRDSETKKLCAERGIVLYLFPDTVARGFFGH